MGTQVTSKRSARRRGFAIVLASLLLIGVRAHADVECTISAGPLYFGNYDPLLAQPNDSTANTDVTCSWAGGSRRNTLVAYVLALSTGASGTYAQRHMLSGNDRLPYNLFTDAARSQIWGDSSGGTGIGSGAMRIGSGQGNNTDTRNHTIYGRIPAQLDAEYGDYGDTIFVTLIF
jgi:spore coat protein U-like protein